MPGTTTPDTGHGLPLAGIDALPGWHQDWFTYIGDLVWHFRPHDIQPWAARLTNLDGTPIAPSSRGRAVSAVCSFYTHCENDLGAARWNLPPRRAHAKPSPSPSPFAEEASMDAR